MDNYFNVKLYFAFLKTIDILLVATSVFVIGLFQLRYPTGTNHLDESWPLACSIASANKMLFGSEILYTLGPLSELYTHSYNPVTIQWTFPLSILLGLCYGIGLLFIIPRENWRLKFWMIFIAAALTYLPDALLMGLAIHPGIFIFQTLHRQERPKSLTVFWWMKFVVLLFPLGILPFVKGTAFSLTGIVCLLSAGILIVHQRKFAALTTLLVPLILAAVIWAGLGYSLADLPTYIQESSLLISGYSEAMSIGPLFDINIFLFVLTSATMVLGILFYFQSLNLRVLYLFVLFSLYLFLSFKGSFVRYDIHPLFYGLGILVAMVLFRSVIRSRLNPAISALAILTYLSIDMDLHNSSVHSIYNHLKTTFKFWKTDGAMIFREKHQLDLKYQKSLESIHEKDNLDKVPGTADMYSFNQMGLFAAGMQWTPRPIFQSILAFTPHTAKMNRDFLLSENSPNYLFFKLETIDNRYPTLDDGISLPEIIANYTPNKYSGEYLILSKNNPKNRPAQMTKEVSFTRKATSQVLIPQTENPLFAEISLEKSFLGKLLSVFYKIPPVSITLQTVGDQKITRRFIAPMAESGFLLSPFINSTESFSYLFDDRISLRESKIEWMKLQIDHPILWKDSMSITLSSFDRPDHFNIKSIGGGKTGVSALQAFDLKAARIDTLEQCQGHLDRINGLPVQETNEIFLNTLTLSGWLAHSPEGNITWDEVFILLTDSTNATFVFPTNLVQRPDVANHFGKQTMESCGFTTDLDIRQFNGQYRLHILYRNGDSNYSCSAPSTTLIIRE